MTAKVAKYSGVVTENPQSPTHHGHIVEGHGNYLHDHDNGHISHNHGYKHEENTGPVFNDEYEDDETKE